MPSPARWIGRKCSISGRCSAGAAGAGPARPAHALSIGPRVARKIKPSKRVSSMETSMGDEQSIIELTIPTVDVDDAVARVCDEWGVEREAVKVEQLDAPAGQGATADRVLLRITLLTAGSGAEFDDEDEDA